MAIEFREVDDFYKYVEDSEPAVAVSRVVKDGFEVILNGYYDIEVLGQIIAKMKELQEVGK